ncbi:MAG: methyltransferase domain-containing protein [Verrucomicrobia bacterium]|nr:methyltransferase domain-containing protein [Verrucomicrobiota bacterium]
MIGPRFSAAAETYDRHARPQLALAQSVVAVLPEMYPEQILELGSGTGQLTRLLVERFPEVPIDAIDVAEKMVAHSRAKFKRFPQISWIVGDAQTYWGGDRYPLIVSSSALHWVSDLRKTCENIFQSLEPGGTFALGMMLQGTLKELHDLREEIAPEKTPLTTLPTYEETSAALEAAGFRIERKKHSEEQILYPDAKAFLKAIHEQGVTGGKVSAGNAPLTRTELGRLVADYQENHASDDGVHATYETATFLLTKA